MWGMFKKAYTGLKEFRDNVYSGFKNEWNYHKNVYRDGREDLVDKWDFSKQYYKEKWKEVKKNLSSKSDLYMSMITGILTGITGCRGFSDTFGYECPLEFMKNLGEDECKGFSIGIGLTFLKFVNSYLKGIKRGTEISILKKDLEISRKRQEERYKEGMKEAGKEIAKSRKISRLLMERLAGQDEEMAKLRKYSEGLKRDNEYLKKDSEFQVKALKELLKEKRERNRKKEG